RILCARRHRHQRIARREEHRAERCPECQGRLRRTNEVRTRYVEDVPDDLRPICTEHGIHRACCPRCQKRVEPRVPAALPGATLGNQTLALSAWLHYGLGHTLAQV